VTDWGRHGVATADLWSVLFRDIVAPTAELASGVTQGGTVRFPPFVQTNVADPPTKGVLGRAEHRDQDVVSGGPGAGYFTADQVTETRPDGSWLRNISDARRRELEAVIEHDVVHDMLYPWRFYALGQQYLARLAALKPPLSAPVEQRMIWAVDVAWWINMMLAATNVYPSWIPDALASLLNARWTPKPWVPLSDDLAPSLGLTSGGGFYPLPFAAHPGEFAGADVPGTRADARAFAGISRWVSARPWWLGIQTWGDVESAKARAMREDPRMDANLLRAVMQHSFFQFPNTSENVRDDFFATVERIKTNSRVRDSFETFTEKVAPAWLTAMRKLPYWSIVRAGQASWYHYSAGVLDVSLYPSQPESEWRWPMTAWERGTVQQLWIDAKEQDLVNRAVGVEISTLWAIIQTYVGNYGTSQVNALKAWYDIATFRYKVPKSWERSWEPPPLVMRMQMFANGHVVPNSRAKDIGQGVMEATSGNYALGAAGGIALMTERMTDATTAFELATDIVTAPPPPPVPDPALPPEPKTPFAATTFAARKKPSVVPYVVGGVAAVVGVLLLVRRSR